ncbi:hypothetical protein EB796_022408 [Bugula neritina]|uniref:Uncharacterized protein n=1 Tax=Bugula neritina TaxID=10212 RepID=A0A7J7J0P5_BUGNE|nr:hypothetical protein EB796_022408 [Bugula neritina]
MMRNMLARRMDRLTLRQKIPRRKKRKRRRKHECHRSLSGKRKMQKSQKCKQPSSLINIYSRYVTRSIVKN